jgi:predicted RNA-binding Zn-ribbon protein involved in translation (DUF1610 family)
MIQPVKGRAAPWNLKQEEEKMQSINFVFEKQEHDCYSRRKVAEDGTLTIKFVCPMCGVYRKFKRFSDGRRKWKVVQRSSYRHSGVSLPNSGQMFFAHGRLPGEWQPKPTAGA